MVHKGRYSKTHARNENLLEIINFVRSLKKEFIAGGLQKCSPKKIRNKSNRNKQNDHTPARLENGILSSLQLKVLVMETEGPTAKEMFGLINFYFFNV